MNYDGEKEKASRKNSTRGITLLLNEEKNQIKERHWNPTSDTNFSNSDAGKVKLETDCLRSKQNGVRGNSLKESLNSISRLGLILNLSYLYFEYIHWTCNFYEQIDNSMNHISILKYTKFSKLKSRLLIKFTLLRVFHCVFSGLKKNITVNCIYMVKTIDQSIEQLLKYQHDFFTS